MNKSDTTNIIAGVAGALQPLQFPFLVREKGALIDRQSLSFISLPQVATGLRYACRARSVGGTFSRTKFCTWMAATCAVASHSFAEGGLVTKLTAYKGSASFAQDFVTVPDKAIDKHKIACANLLYGEVHDGDISSFD